MSREKPYSSIVAHYEDCLSRFGDTHLGVNWQNADDAYKRYQIMLDIIKPEASKITLLDFGCGTAGLLDYINEKKILYIDYSGLEISTEFFNVSKKKYPNNTFFNMDILDKDALLPCFDYIIMNGVFTEKIDLSHNIMFSYFCSMIETIYPHCRKGIAFNLRSKQVMAEDQDLFHLSLDELAWFLVEKFGRNFIIRNDYGLEEYAVYICKEP